MNLEKELTGRKILVLSPHFDDAVLSCGSLLLKLKGKADVTIVNIFTEAHSGPYTFSGKKFLHTCGEKNAKVLFAKRLAEDKKALAILGAKQINLGLVDGLYRKKKSASFLGRIIPEFDHLYPTYTGHLVRGVSKGDNSFEELNILLKQLTSDSYVVLAPYGLGKHADHLVVRKASEEVFGKLIYYADFPYSLKVSGVSEDFSKAEVQTVSQKKELIRIYQSQIAGLFADSIIPEVAESYFIKL